MIKIYPCTSNGKLKKGFCLCSIESQSALISTLSGWLKFGINYYAISENGCNFIVRDLKI